MFSPEILLRISKEVGASVARVETTIKLFEDGATVPFIARYRKEATGNHDEVKIRDIEERRQYYTDLESLAAYLWEQIGDQPAGEFAEKFINLEKEILTIEAAIEGALHIIAERIAETPEFRRQLREMMQAEGKVIAKVVQGKETEKTK